MADEYIDKVEVGAKIQMMYIRREMDYGGENDFCRGMRKALRIIENTPSADVQPMKHGTWRKAEQCYDTYVECSECGLNLEMSNYVESEWRELLKYCPYCGARMDGDTE